MYFFCTQQQQFFHYFLKKQTGGYKHKKKVAKPVIDTDLQDKHFQVRKIWKETR